MAPFFHYFEYFRGFDLFGIRPALYFKGRKKSGTGFGVCLTFLLLVFTTLCFLFFGQDLYYRKNPQLRYNEAYNPFPEGIVLDPEVSPIIIEINSPMVDVFYTNKSIVNMNVSQFTMKQTSNGPIVSVVDYRMEICRSDHFDKLEEKTKQYFLAMNLKDYFCIPKDLKNLTMLGSFDQPIFQTIKFTISICNNASSGGICATTEEIKSTMERGFIGIYFVDYNINPGEYKNPKESQPKEVFTNFVINSQKEIDIFMKNNYIETDDGVMLTDIATEKVINYDSYTEMDFRLENPDFLLVYLKVKQKDSYYRRTYSKIQQLLAQIGGFINCFWILAFAINFLHSHLVMISEIIMNVFSVKFFLDKDKDRTNRKSVNLPSVTSKNNDDMKSLESYSKNLKPHQSLKRLEGAKQNNFVLVKDNEKLQKAIFPQTAAKTLQYYENMKLTTLDYLYYYTGLFKTPERERKKIVINEGEKILSTCLDIKYIISKFYEIEKLKQVLLTKDELKKFSHLPKPEIKIDLAESRKGHRSAITTLVGRKVTVVDREQSFGLEKLNRSNT